MSKTFVVDTNVIVQHPYFLNTLKDALVIIPSIVLQEVDNFKKDDQLSRNVRIFANKLDALYEDGYKIKEQGISVFIDTFPPDQLVLKQLGGESNDNLIIGCAKYWSTVMEDVTLLSNDTLVRVKARGLGLVASKFTSDEVVGSSDGIYSGQKSWATYGSYIDELYTEGFLSISDELKKDIFPHMFIKITEIGGSKTALAKVNSDKTKVELLNPNIKPVSGIVPKNAEQRMALQVLLDPDIPLVTLVGKAGTGKTLLSMASGLALSEDEIYTKITLTKPVVPMGKDIGYLPGGKEEKLGPWMASYYDNLEFLFSGEAPEAEDLQEQLHIQIEALTYIRGRSLPNQFIVIDEAQNLTKHEIKSIITRAGEGTKVIIMGDPDQIDAPHLDPINNGLTYVINKFKDQDIAAHITLTKGHRSKLAEIAANIL
jgi:PhoH-like ATPase